MTRIGHRWSTAVVAIALVAAPLAACGSEGQPSALPAVDLVPIVASGEVLSAADIDGPAVVNLWATWCGPCRKELPAFQAVADRLQGTIAVLGVNQGDDAAPAGLSLVPDCLRRARSPGPHRAAAGTAAPDRAAVRCGLGRPAAVRR